MSDVIEAKRRLRREMRAVRRSLADTSRRSERLWDRVWELGPVRDAAVLMAYTAVPGEPDTEPLISRCRAAGIEVVLPLAEPTAAPPDRADRIDVVVVPGLAFTAGGARLGQGGGWYDRVVATLRPDCLSIGACFSEQLVTELPVEAHDIVLDIVATDRGLVE